MLGPLLHPKNKMVKLKEKMINIINHLHFYICELSKVFTSVQSACHFIYPCRAEVTKLCSSAVDMQTLALRC